ncbi:LamG-like jellyroll fold domain-containing protein [Sinomicrobium sp. M5D2P9]
MKKYFLTLLFSIALAGNLFPQEFVHPGGLHTQEDLDRMKAKVAAGESPWIEGWNALVADWKSSSTYGISGGVRENANQRQNMNRDAQAAYLNALRWYISGDVAHAEKAISIYNAYANTVNQIPSGGNTDILGLGGIGFTAMAIGAEIMRLYEGWAPEDFEKFKFMMKEYFYPVSHDFLTNHRGACPTHYWANWDLNNISALVAIGILVDDRDIFNEGIAYFKNGIGAGSIQNAVPFVQGNFGQWQESGRDQSHGMLGIGLMANTCQLAWNQGVDLYGYDNNRFLKGAEYVARTGALSLEAPFFEEYNSCSNRRHRWVAINALGRYFDQPVWEIVYNHYVVKQGLEAPHVRAMAQIMRLAGSTNDQLGHGTLTYTLDSDYSPPDFAAPPGQLQGLIANEGIGRVQLRWNAPESMDAIGYVVKRSTTPGGPYEELSRGSGSTNPVYTDTNVENGTTYYYVVSAHNKTGEGPDSEEIVAIPKDEGEELPAGWARADIGNLSIEGEAVYAEVNTGHAFITKGGGVIGGTSDALGFTYGVASGDVTLTARIADFGGVQKTGIMIRESLDPDARTVLMKIGDVGWRVAAMGARTGTGANMEWIGGNRYTWRPEIWFRISRTGNTFTVYESNNKEEWFEVGSRTIEMGANVYVGLFNSSGNTTSLNTTRYDHVAITGLDSNVPDAPANLTASPGNTRNMLDWDEVTGASSYTLKRSTTSGGPYEVVATNLNVNQYTDNGLENGTTYHYVISAANLSGESVNSLEVDAAPELAVAPAPEEVTAESVSGQQINLSWNASISATSYHVKRATVSGGPYTIIASPGTTSFSDIDVNHSNTYYYVISAVNELGESEDSEEVSATPGKIAYLAFDETEGSIAADTWADTDGTLIGGATWGEGIVNNGILLNGSGDSHVELPAGLMAGVNDFTISTWVKLDENPTWGRIFDFGSGTDTYMFLSPGSSSNTVRYSIRKDNIDQQINSSPVLSVGDWHHVAVTQSGDVVILYVDGEEVGRNENMTLSPSDLGNTAQNWIGKSQWPDPLLKGTVDEFKIYSKALDALEIASVYQELAPPNSPKDLGIDIAENMVSLSWSAGETATSYNVKRASTREGPYNTIAEVTTTSYEESYTKEDTYFYVVSAVNSNGESVNSTWVSTNRHKYIYLKFDETEGNIATDSWSGLDGTLESGAGRGEGTADNAVHLDGTNESYATLPEGIMTEINDFTICTWVRLDEVATWARIFDFGTENDNSMFLTPKTSTSGEGIRFAIKTRNGYPKLSYNHTWEPGTWTHIAVTLSEDTATMYLNGEPVASSTDFTKRPSDLGNTTNNYLGKGQNTVDPHLKGAIDEFKIFNRALSATEILDAMKLPPYVLAKDITVALNEEGQAVITPEQVNNGSESYRGDLGLSLDITTFDCSHVQAPVKVTLTGVDDMGYSSTSTATITVLDSLKPSVVAPAEQFYCYDDTETYSVPELVATDNCGIDEVKYTVSGSTTREGTGVDASGNFNVGESTITWTAMDIQGNHSVDSTVIVVNPPLTVDIADTYAMDRTSSVVPNTIYPGYDPAETLTIRANAFGGEGNYTYLWNTGQNTETIDVSAEGTYSVTITDAKGCSATTQISIAEVNVGCGKWGRKVEVCFHNNKLCVESLAVAYLLDYGGHLGTCSAETAVNAMSTEEDHFIIYPNPAHDFIAITAKEAPETNGSLQIFNSTGQLVKTQEFTDKKEQILDIKGLPGGIYVLKIKSEHSVTTRKIIKN